MDWRVPLADVNFGLEEEQAVQQVLRSGWLSMGEVTKGFEQEFAAFIGAKHTLAVTNATAALHLACLAAGIGPGDLVTRRFQVDSAADTTERAGGQVMAHRTFLPITVFLSSAGYGSMVNSPLYPL